MKITVAGAGNSGQTTAADLALAGHEVTLFELPAFAERIAYVEKSGVIEKYGSLGTTGRTGRARIAKVTTQSAAAFPDAEIIILCVPAYAHTSFFETFVEHLRPGQIVLVSPGNWGAWRLRQLLTVRGKGKGVYTAETDICLHICRADEPFLGPGRVRVILERKRVLLAATPARDTELVLAKLKPIYPFLVPAKNVVETSLNNSNIVTHGPLMLMNAGWIEHTSGNVMIYRDGVTTSVARTIDVVGQERDEVLRALGFAPRAVEKTYERIKNAKWVLDPCETAPPSLSHRYLSEDVPFGLVPLADIARALNVTTPAADAMITLAGIVNGVDYRREGLSLKKLGLTGLSADGLLRLVEG